MHTSSIRTALIALGAAAAIASAANAAPIEVTVEGVEDRGGVLYVALQTEAQFMKEDGIVGNMLPAPSAGDHTFQFDVPEGRYSLSVWHDDNGNNTFDRASNGEPLDGWAMINGAEMTGLPAFEDVSVEVPASGASVKEAMIYGR